MNWAPKEEVRIRVFGCFKKLEDAFLKRPWRSLVPLLTLLGAVFMLAADEIRGVIWSLVFVLSPDVLVPVLGRGLVKVDLAAGTGVRLPPRKMEPLRAKNLARSLLESLDIVSVILSILVQLQPCPARSANE